MPHPESDRLRRALVRHNRRAVLWSGVVYRSASPAYAKKDDLLSGVGSRISGARWNPPRSFPTVYRALTRTRRSTRYLPTSGTTRSRSSPRCHGSWSRSGSAWRGCWTLPMGRPDWPSASQSARCSMNAGGMSKRLGGKHSRKPWDASPTNYDWKGSWCSSVARRGGMNLVIFPGNLSPRSSLDIINLGDLPRSR